MDRVVLEDRDLATLLDALTMTRDQLRGMGYSGNDCQATYDKIVPMIEPDTYRLILTKE